MTFLAFDFIVLGTEERATDWLRGQLSGRHGVWMPAVPEEPFFGDDARFARGVEWFEREILAPPPAAGLVGISGPEYMGGSDDVGPQLIARRVATTHPEVRLVALLSDPVVRATSRHRESIATEERARELLDSTRLEAARWREPGVDRYIVDGEYGRILASYGALLPRDQLLIAYWEDVQQRPAELVSEILDFLGVEEASTSSEGDSLDGEASPGEVPPPAGLPVPVTEQLERLYRQDAEILTALFGSQPPWPWVDES